MNHKYTRREELANALSHLSGALLAAAGLILMVCRSVMHGNVWHVVTTSVFGSSMTVLYISSTLTHILPVGRRKDFFFNFDRIAIYLLIAGTYTPIALVTLQGTFGWVIFGLEWAFAAAGTLMILVRPGNYQRGVSGFFVVSYALMGWMILAALVPVIRTLPFMGWLWILIGGLFYTMGILFFSIFKFRYHHLVWHLMVMAGSISHFFAVFFYIIPG